MLTAGIAIMVASIVLGVIALTAAALTAPATRSAGRRTRTAMALSDEEEEALPPATEPRESPRWMLMLAILSAGGLVLGLLLVMIASLL